MSLPFSTCAFSTRIVAATIPAISLGCVPPATKTVAPGSFPSKKYICVSPQRSGQGRQIIGELFDTRHAHPGPDIVRRCFSGRRRKGDKKQNGQGRKDWFQV